MGPRACSFWVLMPISAPRPRAQEAGDAFLALAHDAFAVLRAVAGDVPQGLVGGVHGADGHLVVQEFRAEALVRGGLQQGGGVTAFEGGAGARVGIQGDVAVGQPSAQGGKLRQPRGVHDEAVQGVAHAHPARLGVIDDAFALVGVAVFVEVRVADARSRLDDGHERMAAHEVDKSPPAARDDDVHVARGLHQLGGGLVPGGQQGHRVRVDAPARQHGADELHDGLVGVPRVAAALEHAGVARLQAQGCHVEAHVGACLVDDAHHAEGHAHLAQGHAVGAHRLGQHPPQGRGQRGHVAHVGGDALDAFAGEQQAVAQRVGGIHGGQVEGVGFQQAAGLRHGLVGHGQQRGVDFVLAQQVERARGVQGVFFPVHIDVILRVSSLPKALAFICLIPDSAPGGLCEKLRAKPPSFRPQGEIPRSNAFPRLTWRFSLRSTSCLTSFREISHFVQ